MTTDSFSRALLSSIILLSSTAACQVPASSNEEAVRTAKQDHRLRPPARHRAKRPGKHWSAATGEVTPVGETPPAQTPPEQTPPEQTPPEETPPPPLVFAAPETVTGAATSLGLDAFSANGRVQPHGAPAKTYFEYGATTAYGSRTPSKALAPRLAAYHTETWNQGLGGWAGGGGADLAHVASGGVDGGHVRYSEPTGDDYNHVDGVGTIHLVQYMNSGTFASETQASAALGGGWPDMRDARVQISVRGNGWKTSGSELVWWSQTDIWHGKPPADRNTQFTNWAYTGNPITDALFSGQWETVTYRLFNDTTLWTYAGTNRALNEEIERSVYAYAPLDDVLANLDTDFFHVLTNIDVATYPEGSIDFDELSIAYRNRSLVFPSNGGKLVSGPEGSDDDFATLTDGWRNGDGRMWKSAASPSAPLELVYAFDRAVMVDAVQLHQHTEWPSCDVEVFISPDADGDYFELVTWGTLPERAPEGPSFAYFLQRDLRYVWDQPVKRVKVRVRNGYRAEHWGLGEIEFFGEGAAMQTDDDWYRVNADITGLAAGETVHYRLVTETDGATTYGEDMIFTVPATTKPEVATGSASRLESGSAKLEGRMNSLGAVANVWFQYGTSASYGKATAKQRKGEELTPRTVMATIMGLTPGSTVHYRIVASGAAGTTYGEDRTFVAR